MGPFKVLLLLKTLSWEQINSSSFGLVWKCSTWKQLSQTEVLLIAVATLGKKQACSLWCLVRRCAASGISEGSAISLSSHPSRDASKVVMPFFSAYSTVMGRDMQQKGEGQWPFFGQYILASYISSYIPLSPFKVKALCWPPRQLLRPTKLLIQTLTQGKKGAWKLRLHTLLTFWMFEILAPV